VKVLKDIGTISRKCFMGNESQ